MDAPPPGAIGPSPAVTKLRPPRPHGDAVARPRLDALLDEATRDHTVTLVSAPAGYGKTTALAAWVRAHPGGAGPRPGPPVAWVALDERDDEPRAFTRLVAAAVATLDPRAGAIAAAGDLDLALASLVNLLDAADGARILVLDDLHVLTREDTLDALRWLVDHAPAALRLVLATRVDPPLPLARWRLQGALVELRADGLAFRPDEAGALLERMGVALDPEALAVLVSRTEGWGAGLQLAALSLRGREGRYARDFVERFTGRDRYVLAYLTEEVLQRLDPATHDFLLMASVLDAFDAATAAAVTGRHDALELLTGLERANLFLSRVGDAADTFRFHAFFRDLLRGRLDDLRPGMADALVVRAARHRAETSTTGGGTDRAVAGIGGDAEALSERELEALRWLATGASNKGIARHMGLSPNTVKTHLRRLFDKLEVRSRTEAVARARALGLL
jgi:LuxR family transcriptional regulator, maltose regulon positive regulatory protein